MSMKALKLTGVLLVLLLGLVVIGCGSDEVADEDIDAPSQPEETAGEIDESTDYMDASDFVDVTVQAGENPPCPTEVEADYATGERHDDNVDLLKDIDFASFTTAWNETVTDMGREEFVMEDIDIRYVIPGINANHTLSKRALDQVNFLYFSTSVEYDTHYLHGLTVGYNVYNDFTENDREEVMDAWKALIIAANPDINTVDDASSVMAQLGLEVLHDEGFSSLQEEASIDGYTYRVDAYSTRGSFYVHTEG